MVNEYAVENKIKKMNLYFKIRVCFNITSYNTVQGIKSFNFQTDRNNAENREILNIFSSNLPWYFKIYFDVL